MTLLVHSYGDNGFPPCRHGIEGVQCPEARDMVTCGFCGYHGYDGSTHYCIPLGGNVNWASPANPSASGPSPNPNPSGLIFHINQMNNLYIQHRNDETCQYCQSPSLPKIQVLPDYHYNDPQFELYGGESCRVNRLTIPANQCPKCKGDFAPRTATVPFVGFRGWTVKEDTKFVKLTPFSKPRKVVTGVQLHAAGATGMWNGRHKVHAMCNSHPKSSGFAPLHQAPQKDCSCGFYIYKNPDFMDYGGAAGQVQGAVIAWGHVIEHAEGFRAEWAQPIFIFDPKDDREHRKNLAKVVAHALQLPLIPFDKDKVARVAKEFGNMVS